MLVYPNEFALPLMPNFGLPPPPTGMLHVKVRRLQGCACASRRLQAEPWSVVMRPPACSSRRVCSAPTRPLVTQVISCKGLKGSMFDRMDPFVSMELRKGREAKVSVWAVLSVQGPLACPSAGPTQTAAQSPMQNKMPHPEPRRPAPSPTTRTLCGTRTLTLWWTRR